MRKRPAPTPLPQFANDLLEEGLQITVDDRYGFVTVTGASSVTGRKCAYSGCGKMFIPKRVTGVCCSATCRVAHHRELQKAKRTEGAAV